MKAISVFLFLFVLQLSVLGQNELVNVYSTYSSMHGGMATSGVSQTATYSFVANEKITLSNLLFNGNKLTLENGDSLIVSTNSYTPYQRTYFDEFEETDKLDSKQIERVENLVVNKTGKRTYLIGLSMTTNIGLALTYSYKNQEFTAVVKNNFDEYQEHYAP